MLVMLITRLLIRCKIKHVRLRQLSPLLTQL